MSVKVSYEDVLASKPELRETEKEFQEKWFKDNEPEFYAILKEVREKNAKVGKIKEDSE
jgi:hypothetical protein